MVSRLTPDNAKVNIGVLEVAHSIFKRWRPLFASDDLYTEINHVLSKFGESYVQLLAVSVFSPVNSQELSICLHRAPIGRLRQIKTTRRS